MKLHAYSLIRPHAARLAGAIAAAAVLAVALCSIFFPGLPSFAMPLMQAGIIVCIAAGWLSAARETASQQGRGLARVRIRRRD